MHVICLCAADSLIAPTHKCEITFPHNKETVVVTSQRLDQQGGGFQQNQESAQVLLDMLVIKVDGTFWISPEPTETLSGSVSLDEFAYKIRSD